MSALWLSENLFWFGFTWNTAWAAIRVSEFNLLIASMCLAGALSVRRMRKEQDNA